MIARLLPAADFAIDARANKARGDGRAEKQMIDAQPGVALIGIPEVIPKGVDKRLPGCSLRTASIHP